MGNKKETVTSTIEKYGLDFKARGHNLTVYFNDNAKSLLGIAGKDIKNITIREPEAGARKELKVEIIKQLDSIGNSKTENSITTKLKKLFKLMKSEDALKEEREKAVKKAVKRQQKKQIKKTSKDASTLIDELEGLELSTSDLERLGKLSGASKNLQQTVKPTYGRSASGEH